MQHRSPDVPFPCGDGDSTGAATPVEQTAFRRVTSSGAMMSGRLEVVCSAVNVTLQVAASLEPLYEAHFRGPAPEVQVNGGTVTLTYPRRRDLADGGLAGAAITLKGSLPWEIEFDSVSKLVADLSTLPLRSLDVTGSISEGTVLLPPRLGGSLSALRGAPARYASSVWAGSPFGCCSARPRPR